MNRRWCLAVLRLTTLLAGTSLATSRIGLLLHELVGHGGMAIAVGGTVTNVQLFWFAGGWISYRVPGMTTGQDVAITLGGIGIEAVLGVTLWVALRRRDSLGARILRTLGAILVGHAMFYLGTGTWHGYGDGRLIHALLGDARYPVAIAAGLLACGAGFLAARCLFGEITATVPAPRLAGVLLAIMVAGGVNLALDLGELRIRRDTTYQVTMQPERERIAARELQAWQRARANVTDEERAARARELAAQHRDFPFVWLLAGGILVAGTAGALRSQRRSGGSVSSRLIAVACGIAAISTAAVIAIDAAFHHAGMR